MASISSVITGGFGTPGSASLVITDGYGTAAIPVIVTPTTVIPGVGRRVRFLRRAPKLPWEDREDEVQEQEVEDAAPAKRRIRLPSSKPISSEIGPLKLDKVEEIRLQAIVVPDASKADLDDEDEDNLMLWMI